MGMIVVDANVAAWAVLPNIAVIQTLQHFTVWGQQGQRIIALDLWAAEAASVFCLCVFSKKISKEEGQQALIDLFTLAIESIPTTEQLCQAALLWATKLQHARLYDSLYLALAEQHDIELWTADKRLMRGAKQHGFSKIHWIGEPVEKENL
jgi:predicted nucleic acid-binding protein